ncbi:MAG: BrnT family toxin [Bacteroidota bacterium]
MGSEEPFLNIALFVFPDSGHSQKEARFYALGRTSASRHLFIVFTVHLSRIRIDSARDMNRKEKKVYAEKPQEASQV